MINKGVVMKTRYDDAVFKFKRLMLELAARYQSKVNVNAYSLNTEAGLEKLYVELKKVEDENVLIKEPYLRMYENINAVQTNYDAANIKEVKWFVSHDLHIMFITQELYNSIIRYYRFYAKYNLKNVELENAIKDWMDMAYPKPTLKEFVLGLFKKNLQK